MYKSYPYTGNKIPCCTVFFIYGFTNEVFTSTTWLIVNTALASSIIIDPGSSAIPEVVPFLEKNNIKPEAVVLTHEHFDHCLGVNPLAEIYDFKLIATRACIENIAIPARNHSLYYDGCEVFSIKHSNTQSLSGETKIELAGISFLCVPTPGHTPGGMCVLAQKAAFTGDTVLNNIPTPLNFRNSNKAHYKQSIARLKELLHDGTSIYPGHGEPFIYKTGII